MYRIVLNETSYFIVITGHLRHIPHTPEWEIRLVCPIRSYFTMPRQSTTNRGQRLLADYAEVRRRKNLLWRVNYPTLTIKRCKEVG